MPDGSPEALLNVLIDSKISFIAVLTALPVPFAGEKLLDDSFPVELTLALS